MASGAFAGEDRAAALEAKIDGEHIALALVGVIARIVGTRADGGE